ncbi:hypothetical protein [Paenibacillus macerans]|uniref:hypothetical protein n=1 Tax=Paenibacillus macerans TaxID=44252 RepID=UPI001D131760|nr:hypothetical protein [Paenibacillus macerans]
MSDLNQLIWFMYTDFQHMNLRNRIPKNCSIFIDFTIKSRNKSTLFISRSADSFYRPYIEEIKLNVPGIPRKPDLVRAVLQPDFGGGQPPIFPAFTGDIQADGSP